MRNYFLLFLTVAPLAFAQSDPALVVIDGELREGLWVQAKPGKLTPTEPGVPQEMGGEVRAVLSGRYLYLAARLPEPSGRFTARSIGKNPRWEEEDTMTFVIRLANENDWLLQVGPLGAYSVKWRWTGEPDWYISQPEKCEGFLVTAGTGEKEWRVEAAIPLAELGSPRGGSVHVNVERVRASRPGAPAEHWRWPGAQPMAEVPGLPALDAKVSDPVFRPRAIGNGEEPIEAGRRDRIPSLESEWTDDAWRDVPAWPLYRNESGSRAPVFPTEVKIMQDGTTLAVMARCAEPYGTVAEAQERDGPIDRDDSFQLYLATSGSEERAFRDPMWSGTVRSARRRGRGGENGSPGWMCRSILLRPLWEKRRRRASGASCCCDTGQAARASRRKPAFCQLRRALRRIVRLVTGASFWQIETQLS
jgi:hypothetical protein